MSHTGNTYNIYCDESCHLENDGQPLMVLGAVWCALDKVREVAGRLKEIKRNNGLDPRFEVKWTKVSPGKRDAYLDLIDYFFDDDDLHFRGLIAPKKKLDHGAFQQTHDDWYYKMYFDMLKILFEPHSRYRVYVDIKDTRGGEKIAKLHDVLCNNMYDFSRSIIERIQLMHSHEFEILQLTDLLVGAVSYANRNEPKNQGKVAIVERIRERSGYSLTKTTLIRENKVNLFHWEAS